MNALAAAWLIARKDLRTEFRSRELVYTTLFFAMACVLVFEFALATPGPAATAAVIWIAVLFSGTLALGRTFERERQHETLRALLLAPVERGAVYLGKLMGLMILMIGIQVVLLPIVGILLNAPIGRAPGYLAGLLAAGTLGFAVVGTLFSAMLSRVQSRDILLPVVLYPLTVPVVITGVEGTASIFGPEPNFDLVRVHLAMLVSFDAVFVTLALWTFGAVMAE